MKTASLFLITALLLIIPFAASIPFAVLPDVGINGTVKDAFGIPIAGAEVTILGL
ncbi:carboxypeptidase regulatory-like domain-containing protein, partial [Candidatus Woesearchaeota archaeon]|nr:carboxypeptidase regulatory-like domain-containing protein [Candidatus Woesearchaeota archaeon]